MKSLPFNRILIFCLFFLSLNCARTTDENTVVLRLDGEDWGIYFNDNTDLLNPEFNPNNLDIIVVPNNFRNLNKSYRGSIWIRKSFEITTEQHQKSLALQLGKVYQSDEVFVNGVLIGKNNSAFGKDPEEFAFGRPRIYPIPHDLLLEGENVLIIKIDSALSTSAGIITGPIRIVTYEEAINGNLYDSLVELIFVGFYLFIALFFFINFFNLRDKKEYLSFSILALIFSGYELCKNEVRFLILNHFAILKFLEYSFLFILPYGFIKFIQDFFELKPFRYQRIYLLLQFFFIAVFLIIQNPVFWYNFIGYWDIHLLAVIGYAIYVTIIKFREQKRGSTIHLLALVYLLYSILKEILIERGYLNSPSSLETSFLVYLILMTLALRFQFLMMKRKLQNRYERLKEADSLREKIFFYMDAMISGPLKLMKEKLSAYRESTQKTKDKNLVKEVIDVQSSIDNVMDDIIELSRLEVLKEVPFKEQVNFISFINDVIPEDDITYSIKVNPETEIYNSLDLINSVVVRLVDFPPFKEFNHNDLIITQDLKGNVHFRFLLFHNNSKVAQKLFNELTENYNQLTPIKVKWAIILEIVRLLGAKIDFKIIKKKYLKIDLGIAAIVPISELQPIKDSNGIPNANLNTKKSEKEDWRVTLKRIFKFLKETEIKIPNFKKKK
ncbi:membrane protein [Leptospira biflexa]|uniref:7TM-DISM domain-containing protein n=1 Tax=Leptospira biflexa TaxID=172 RepID=UPI001090E2E8|nr:7TM-DISM domain-containing protein [Leptospira biflexa]TGM46555.1 membrane protein [Leptospira biflexa]TGM50982.1 membrane protein [Leptospira biflexa]